MRVPSIAIALILCALGSSGLAGETRVVITARGGRTVTATTEMRESIDPSGARRVEELGGAEDLRTLLAADGTAAIVEVSAKEGSARMVCDGKGVDVSGTWKGVAVRARCDLEGRSFYGRGFSLAARAFVRGGLKDLEFAYVRLDRPSKAVAMVLKSEGPGNFKGRPAIAVRLSPAGVLSAFWSARLLLDGQGNLLRYEGDLGPGTASFVSELVEVRP